MLHRHNTLQMLEYLVLGTLSRILNTSGEHDGGPPSCSMADFQSNECITSL